MGANAIPPPSTKVLITVGAVIFGICLSMLHQSGLGALFLLAPSAFFIIGFLVWAIRAWKPDQNEEPDFKPMPLPDPENRP